MSSVYEERDNTLSTGAATFVIRILCGAIPNACRTRGSLSKSIDLMCCKTSRAELFRTCPAVCQAPEKTVSQSASEGDGDVMQQVQI